MEWDWRGRDGILRYCKYLNDNGGLNLDNSKVINVFKLYK